MASHSPQRTRKATAQQPQPGQPTQGPTQETTRREKSPTPSIRDRQPQRASFNAQSIPAVPPLNAQMLERYQEAPRQPRQASFDNGHEASPERRSLPPPPAHAQSTQAVPQVHQLPSQPIHSHSQPVVPTVQGESNYGPTHHNPRPMNPIPQNLLTRNWQEQAASPMEQRFNDDQQGTQGPLQEPRELVRQSLQEPIRKNVQQESRQSMPLEPRQSAIIPPRAAIPYDDSQTYPEGHGGVAYAGALSRGNSLTSVTGASGGTGSLGRGNSMNTSAARGQPLPASPKQATASSPKERARPVPKDSSPIQGHSSPRESPKARQSSSPNTNNSFSQQQQQEPRYVHDEERNEDTRYGDDGSRSYPIEENRGYSNGSYPEENGYRRSQTPEPHQIPLPSPPAINYATAQHKYPPRVPSPLSGRRPSIAGETPARVGSPLSGRRTSGEGARQESMRSINQELRSFGQDMNSRPIITQRMSSQLHSQVHTPPLQMINPRPMDSRTPESQSPSTRTQEAQPRTPEAMYPSAQNPNHLHHSPEPVKTRTTPDRLLGRSLPVQEELDDETHHVVQEYHSGYTRTDVPTPPRSNSYRKEPPRVENEPPPKRMPSPTPSSDLNPEGYMLAYGGRESRAAHREVDDDPLSGKEEEDTHTPRTRSEEEESYTPRSPSVQLPEDHNATVRAPKGRTGATDQVGMRGIQSSMFEPQPDVVNRAHENQSRVSGISGMSSAYDQQESFQRLHEQYQAFLRYSREFGGQESRNSVNPDELQAMMEGAPALQNYMQSSRPNAPVPPTPLSETAPSPAPGFPLPVGSPYPYPFNHVPRNAQYSSQAQQQQQAQPMVYETNGTESASYEAINNPAAIQQQLAQQLHMYALNNNPPPSSSAFSPSSTPFQAAALNPWAVMAANKMFGGIATDLHSMQSSPSHEPLPMHRGRNLKRRQPTNLKKNFLPPPRVESTQPRETSPEPSTSGEETAGEEQFETAESSEDRQWVAHVPESEDEDDGDWVDEDEGDEGEDLMHLEYHPDFISNVQKRGRRFEAKWETLIEAFRAVDRQTDATMVLLASPSHSTKLHSLTSRSIRRDGGLINSPAMTKLRSSFRTVATRRRISRPPTLSLTEKLLNSSDSSVDSDGSSSREETLARALEGALGSLGALSKMYDQREMRWRAEMHRVTEDRERVSLLMGQASNGNGHHAHMSHLTAK